MFYITSRRGWHDLPLCQTRVTIIPVANAAWSAFVHAHPDRSRRYHGRREGRYCAERGHARRCVLLVAVNASVSTTTCVRRREEQHGRFARSWDA
jgi:hypothetical protein